MPVLFFVCSPALVFAQKKDTPLYKNPKAAVADRVKDLLGRMTVEEKVGQLSTLLGWEMYEKKGNGVVASDKFTKAAEAQQIGMLWATLRADPWTQKTLETGLDPYKAALATNALQPAGLFGEQGVGHRIGEVDVNAGQLLALGIARQAGEQFAAVFGCLRQQPRPAYRAERHCYQQLGVIGQPGATTGVRPGMIEDVFAVRVPLAVRRQRSDQLLALVMQQVLGPPAGTRSEAAAVFQRAEKRMAQKR